MGVVAIVAGRTWSDGAEEVAIKVGEMVGTLVLATPAVGSSVSRGITGTGAADGASLSEICVGSFVGEVDGELLRA